MKFFALLALFCLAGSAVATEDDDTTCMLCVEFISQSYNELIQAIIQVGVLDGCGDLCALLPSELEAEACSIVCDIVGIDEFVKVISNADPDPIYICELFHICAVIDNGEVAITSFTVNPPAGPHGTTFNFQVNYNVINTTGTGSIDLTVFPSNAYAFGTGGLIFSQTPGPYSYTFQVVATPGESEPFTPGQYPTNVMICNGMCGATHPNSGILAQQNVTFTITPK